MGEEEFKLWRLALISCVVLQQRGNGGEGGGGGHLKGSRKEQKQTKHRSNFSPSTICFVRLFCTV